MKKCAYLSGIIGIDIGAILVCIGAWIFVTHQEGAAAFFKGGILVTVFSTLRFFLSRRRLKQS
jgi:hypothetical protein